MAALGGARHYFKQQPESVQPIDFNQLQLPHTPNYCLVNGQQTGVRRRPAPHFHMPLHNLQHNGNNSCYYPKTLFG